jgi:hypothetical protein
MIDLMNIENYPDKLSFDTASKRIALTGAQGAPRKIVITNRSSFDAFLVVGKADVVATLSGTVVLAKNSVSFNLNAGITHIAAITDSGSGDLYIQVGDGI